MDSLKKTADKDNYFVRRFAKHSNAVDNSIRIKLSKNYILPSQKGLYYFVTVVIMFIWSVNYALSLGYAMTFFAAVFGLIISVLTVDNLSNLCIKPLKNPAFFADERAYFRLQIDNEDAQPKLCIRAQRNGIISDELHLLAHQKHELHLVVDDNQRGKKKLQYLKLYSDYPIGLFKVWTWLYFDANLIIYPKPEGDLALPFLPSHQRFEQGIADFYGSEDFHDLRDYQPGDNLAHVQWRKMIGEKVRVKTFKDLAGQQCILDYRDSHLAHLDKEQRLSQLCQWILLAEKTGTQYSLKLPNKTLAAGLGCHHKTRCLEALACY